MHDVALLVAQDLHLDVPEVLDALFHVQAAVLEGDFRLALCLLEAGPQGGLVMGEPDSPPSPAGGGLDGDRVADLPGDLDGVFDRVHAAVGVRRGGHLGGLGQFLTARILSPRFFMLAAPGR